MANVLISYNRQSKDITIALANDIEAMGHTVWYDQELSGGQSWWDQILTTIRRCDVFAFVLEPAALKSTACTREYEYACELGKTILPILVADGISTNLLPPALSQTQFVDYRQADRKAALSLARAFTSLPPAKPLPDPLPAPPSAPISYLGGLAQQVATSAPLSFSQQTELIVELRRSWRDSEMRTDAQTLLVSLRRRHDLYATIADEIDELLGKPRKSGPNVAVAPEPNPVSYEPPKPPPPVIRVDPPERVAPPIAAAPAMTWRQRLLGALIVWVAAAMVAAATGYWQRQRGNNDDWTVVAAVAASGSAIAGAIIGTTRRMIAIVLPGLFVGMAIWALVDQRGHAFTFGAAFGAPLGAFVAALIATVVGKKKGWA